MKPEKRKCLEEAGWKFGSTADFLNLSSAKVHVSAGRKYNKTILNRARMTPALPKPFTRKP
ncbi:MAG TPA: hypothetical protein DCZ95_07140 [Verrucomicrobia bacterium]|nr:MAG: hypothetical protein A2X46_05530 [Lentisphaerae bacterium GWF2_57_35]HBA83850.1 hypothetical protein [Verrucomicrobiota bacterium]